MQEFEVPLVDVGFFEVEGLECGEVSACEDGLQQSLGN